MANATGSQTMLLLHMAEFAIFPNNDFSFQLPLPNGLVTVVSTQDLIDMVETKYFHNLGPFRSKKVLVCNNKSYNDEILKRREIEDRINNHSVQPMI